MRNLTWLCALAGVAGSLLLVVGCGGSGGGTSGTPDPGVRFVNAVPDSTALDFLVNEDVKGGSIAYLGSTTNFSSVRPSDYDFHFREHGTILDFDDQVYTPLADHNYLIIAAGQEAAATTEPLKRARLAFLDVDRHAPNGNLATLIVFHDFSRATGFETPSIDFQTPGNNPQYSVTSIGFATAKNITVASGAQEFQVRRSGTQQVYADKTLTLGAGKVYLVLATGIEGGTGVTAPDIQLIELSTIN